MFPYLPRDKAFSCDLLDDKYFPALPPPSKVQGPKWGHCATLPPHLLAASEKAAGKRSSSSPLEMPPKVLWTFWNSEEIPRAVENIITSWRLFSPNYHVHILHDANVGCFLPDDDFSWVSEVALRSDLIRLSLLRKYGGIWLDSTVAMVVPVEEIITGGFQAIYTPAYCTKPSRHDFVESWFLAAPRGHPIIKRWFQLLKMTVKANNGKTKGIAAAGVYHSRDAMVPFMRIAQVIVGQTAKRWAEYLIVYGVFGHLYRTESAFRQSVEASNLFRADEVGYYLPFKYAWNMSRVNEALEAADGSHASHEQLSRSKLIKLSTSNLANLKASLARPCKRLRCRPACRADGKGKDGKGKDGKGKEGDGKEGKSKDGRGKDGKGKGSCVKCPPVESCHDSFLGVRVRRTANILGVSRSYFRLVISRHSEDLSWSDRYRGLRTIYNKGDSTLKISRHFDEVYQLKNVGRESESFLRFVVDHYDNLPTFVAFTQAHVDASGGHDWARTPYGPEMFVEMLAEAERDGFSTPMLSDASSKGGDWGFDFKMTKDRYNSSLPALAYTPSTYGEWFRMHGWTATRQTLKLFPTGLLVVHKKHILCQPVEYYERLRVEMAHARNPLEGHYMERAWYYALNMNRLHESSAAAE